MLSPVCHRAMGAAGDGAWSTTLTELHGERHPEMFLRRSAATLATTVAIGMAGAVGAPSATADDSPTPAKLPAGLYGSGDPQYDGVFRQSTALLAQDAVGVRPARQAVNWLAQQQCDGGSFTAYRADSSEPCGSGSAEDTADTNATGMAIQALAVLGGNSKTVTSAVTWLKSVQNKDGGWGYNPGSPTDANSTALVIGALSAAGENPEKVLSRDGDNSPYKALGDLQLGCAADGKERGAFAYQPDEDSGDLTANDAATVAAALAAGGSGLATVASNDYEVADGSEEEATVTAPSCDSDDRYAQKDSSQAASAYLSSSLRANKGHLLSVMPGTEDQPDPGTTTLATLALAAEGHQQAARTPLDWLEKNLDSWDGLAKEPAALGQLVLAVHATGGDPTEFGGTNLVKQLNATGPEPEQAEPDSAANQDEDDSSKAPLLWIVGLGLLAGVGVGVLMSMRNKKAATAQKTKDARTEDGSTDQERGQDG